MIKPLDRITEDLVEQCGNFSEKVRIHWICGNAKGENILDIGCSQGITSILMAQEGKKVLGIDLSEEVISNAQEVLVKEEKSTQEYVDFEVGNFMTMDFAFKTFDCILLGEILNHVTDAQRFIDKAISLLNPNGLIIITVPFGVNSCFNYKRAYYIQELLGFQRSHLVLKDIKFTDKWLGAVFKKSANEERVDIDHKLLSQLESTFEIVERHYLNEINKISILQDEMEQIQLSNIEQQSEIIYLKSRLNELKNQNVTTNSSVNTEVKDEVEKGRRNQKKVSIESIKKNIALEEQLLSSIQSEEKILLSYKKLLRKYNALSNSKLGKLTLYYWKKRRSIFGGK